MAKKHLLHLVERAAKFITHDNDYWREHYNRKVHVYNVDVENLQAQVYAQIKGVVKKPSSSQAANIEKAVVEYAKQLYDTFSFRPSKAYKYTVNGTPKKFYVVIEALQGSGNPFNKLAEIRRSYHKTLQNKVLKALSRIKDQEKAVKLTKGSLNPKTGGYEHGLFDIGHADGSSIAEKRIAAAIGKFSQLPRTAALLESRSSELMVRSRQAAGILKSFVIEVSDESSVNNRGKSEDKWIRDTEKVLKNFVESNQDWANQRGSRSAMDTIVAELMTTAKKHKGKVKGLAIPSKETANRAKTKLTGKTKVVSQVSDIVEIDSPVPTTGNNWSSLIPIINSKLTNTIIENMTAPRLVNRTGTFAQSARLVGVELTAQGFPSFVFDYERKPYDVFDTVKGAAPWNTPERSPSALVSKSIRQIVSELAIGRFYTRRA